MQSLLFVLNPIAGGKANAITQEAITEALKEMPVSSTFFVCAGDDDKAVIQKKLAETKPAKVVAVGGDGTVNLIAEILKDTAVILGIIPAGSANGLAKELGLSTDLKAALDAVINGREGKLDAIFINEEELCFHLSDAGLNALLVKYFAAYKGRGMWGYARSLGKVFWNKRKLRVTIETDDKKIERKAFMVVLANAEKYGTGAVINPGGKVDDGAFEVVVVRHINLIEIFKAVTARKNFDSKHVEVFRTKTASLTFQQKAHFQIDGEYSGKTAAVKARVLPGIVTVMLPRNPPPL